METGSSMKEECEEWRGLKWRVNEWFILSYGTLWFDTCAYHIFLPDKTRFYHQLCWKVKSVGWQKKVTFKDLSALKFCGLASEVRPSCPTIINYLSHPTTSLPPLIQPSQNYAIDRALLNPIPCHLLLAHWFPPLLDLKVLPWVSNKVLWAKWYQVHTQVSKLTHCHAPISTTPF